MRLTDHDFDALAFAVQYARLRPATVEGLEKILEKYPKSRGKIRLMPRADVEGEATVIFGLTWTECREIFTDLAQIQESSAIGAYLPGALYCVRIEDLFEAPEEYRTQQIEFARTEIRRVIAIGTQGGGHGMPYEGDIL